MAWDDFLAPLRGQVQQLIGQNAVLLDSHGVKVTAPNAAARPQRQACLPPGFKDTVETHRNLQDPKVANERYALSDFKPGDLLHTPGADVRICTDGSPEVTLKPGFENGRSAGEEGPVLVPSGPPDASLGQNMTDARSNGPLWFLKEVPNKHPWDYKQRDPRYEAFGNFNYGSAGRAAGLPTGILERGAGWAQQQAQKQHPRPDFGNPYLGSASYGDDPVDQFWIEQGTRYNAVQNRGR